MNWKEISVGLCIFYVLHIILSKYLLYNSILSFKQIFINSIIIAAILCILFYSNDIIKPSFTYSYLLLFGIGVCIFLKNYLLQLGNKFKLNMGLIDGYAIALYLPIITFLLYFLFKEKINKKKIIGIIIISIGSCLILT